MESTVEAGPRWQAMVPRDLSAVHAVSMRAHPDYPERAEVLAEKLRLFPRGCFTLTAGGTVAGYCFSHPWTDGAPPPLDTLLGAMPAQPVCYFIHDLTLNRELRGQGHGRAMVPVLIGIARRLALLRVRLVAVHGRGPFWQAAGFAPTADAQLQAAARASYGDEAIAMQCEVPAG